MGDSLVYFLDAREKDEFNTSHIEGAVHVGYDKFKLNNVKEIPKDAEIIVYCSLGYRSDDVAQKLKQAGFTNVTNLFGGLFQWSNRAYPIVNGKEMPTSMIHGYSESWSQYIIQGTIIY
jgi:rhodanese-related sulfurtransferase